MTYSYCLRIFYYFCSFLDYSAITFNSDYGLRKRYLAVKMGLVYVFDILGVYARNLFGFGLKHDHGVVVVGDVLHDALAG